jgi:hypothetical protein
MPLHTFKSLRSNLLRLSLAAVAAVVVAAGPTPASAEAKPAGAKAHVKSAGAKVHANRANRSTAPAKRRGAARHVRAQARAAGRKVG